MAIKTLLKIVQDVLNDSDGDEVNSINDTVEATQIANIVGSVYEEMAIRGDWPFQKKLTQLQGLSDTTRPTHMILSDDVKEIQDISYDKRKTGKTQKKILPVQYLEPDAFLRTVNVRNNDLDTVDEIIDSGGALLLIRNDRAPTFWTSFDDKEIVFDSFDKEVDATLQKSKTQVTAFIEEPFVLADDAIPPLPSEAFPALISEVKATVAFKIDQIVDSKSENTARKNRSWLTTHNFRTRGGIKFTTNFGRKSLK